MTSIVLIDKNSSVKQTKVKVLSRDTLYKKCGFKVSGGFELRTTWKVNIEGAKMNVELWSRDYGKAGTENKYDFPPPVDTALYFGTCAILRVDDDGDLTDLSVSMWNKIYEKLFGGFEDINDGDDDDSEDELASVPKEMKTKAGYLKDGFVVDDGTDGDDDSDGTDDDHEDNEFINIGVDDDDDDQDDDDEEYDDNDDDDSEGGSELDEDVYQYSSDENS
jgi:hypothetical protein